MKKKTKKEHYGIKGKVQIARLLELYLERIILGRN
jgi:hypothetical protein